MEGNEIYELFGIEAPGADVTEPADPSAETEAAEGVNDQGVAAPEEEADEGGLTDDDNNGEGGDSDAGDDTGGTEGSGKPKQTPEERARYAAARRKAEAQRDAAIAQVRQQAQAEAQQTINAAFQQLGLVNPYTKTPITNKAEYDAYRQQFDAEKKAQLLKKSGMTDQQFQELVQNLPEVREARLAKQAAEDAARQAREQQAKVKVDEQLREIGKLDPAIKELKDLTQMENYDRFYELVKKGNTLVDAFWLANRERLTQNAAAASRQAAMNSARGKRHLAQTASRGAGAVSVPADVKEMYRTFNPNATDEEIQKHYNAQLKRK